MCRRSWRAISTRPPRPEAKTAVGPPRALVFGSGDRSGMGYVKGWSLHERKRYSNPRGHDAERNTPRRSAWHLAADATSRRSPLSARVQGPEQLRNRSNRYSYSRRLTQGVIRRSGPAPIRRRYLPAARASGSPVPLATSRVPFARTVRVRASRPTPVSVEKAPCASPWSRICPSRRLPVSSDCGGAPCAAEPDHKGDHVCEHSGSYSFLCLSSSREG